jgi:hypothetical protein
MDNDGFEFENWMNKHWRPTMAWSYMLICLFDFLLAPIFWSVLQAYLKVPVTQWMPITTAGAGLYHLSMLGIVGVTAWQRTQEKFKYMDTVATVAATTEPPKV